MNGLEGVLTGEFFRDHPVEAYFLKKKKIYLSPGLPPAHRGLRPGGKQALSRRARQEEEV